MKRSLLFGATFIVAAVILSDWLLTIPTSLVTRDSSADLRKKGLIGMLLIGDSTSGRADKAIELYELGIIRTIVLSTTRMREFEKMGLTTNESHVYYNYLIMKGIPADRIDFLDCDASSTLEEGKCFASTYPQESDVVLITNWYHTARAAWLFGKVLDANIYTIPADVRGMPTEKWYTYEHTFLKLFQEYLKWSYWLVKSTFTNIEVP